ncbi:MAG: oxidoreductase [Zetaproteobacteria bacterium]|nr:oxidoreductase [Zetaproteobacteria bacterium]
MIYRGFSFFMVLSFYSLSAQIIDKVEIKTILNANAGYRALEALNDSTVAFANSNGEVGEIALSGKTRYYKIDLPKDSSNHFRAIASTSNYLFALNIESPARLYKFDKQRYNQLGKVVFLDNNPKAFYDAMYFLDDKNGIAMGDPTDDCLTIITTIDGGTTWQKTDCKNLPKIEPGEAAFAASNTNIASSKKNIWIATGGLKSRVFHSANLGKTWNVCVTPFIQGKPTTGIYSMAFYNSKIGIICGGDYTDKSANLNNKAITNNGGKTWKIVANNVLPGYISCVQFVPNSNGKSLIAVGTEGIYLTRNGGNNWTEISTEGFYSIQIVNEHTAFLGGQGTIATLKF